MTAAGPTSLPAPAAPSAPSFLLQCPKLGVPMVEGNNKKKIKGFCYLNGTMGTINFRPPEVRTYIPSIDKQMLAYTHTHTHPKHARTRTHPSQPHASSPVLNNSLLLNETTPGPLLLLDGPTPMPTTTATAAGAAMAAAAGPGFLGVLIYCGAVVIAACVVAALAVGVHRLMTRVYDRVVEVVEQVSRDVKEWTIPSPSPAHTHDSHSPTNLLAGTA